MPAAEFNSLLGRSFARKESRSARVIAPRSELIPNLLAAGPAGPPAREQRTPRVELADARQAGGRSAGPTVLGVPGWGFFSAAWGEACSCRAGPPSFSPCFGWVGPRSVGGAG